MPQANVGSGDIIFQPPNGGIDAAPGVVSTPIRIAELQDITLDSDITLEELEGQKGYPVEAAFTKRKLTGKAKFGKIDGRILAMCFEGSTLTTGSSNLKVSETGTVASGSVTVAGSASFVANAGVYTADGTPYKQVASAPAGTQYSVAAGVYTFNVSENGKLLTFKYTKSQASGTKIVIPNPEMAIATKYGLKLYNTYTANSSKTLAVEFPAVVVPKLSLPFKNTAFMLPDISFTVIDDGTGGIGTAYIDAL